MGSPPWMLCWLESPSWLGSFWRKNGTSMLKKNCDNFITKNCLRRNFCQPYSFFGCLKERHICFRSLHISVYLYSHDQSFFSDMIFSLLVLTVGLAVAQDTYSCPDGWLKEVKRKLNIVMDEVGEEFFYERNPNYCYCWRRWGLFYGGENQEL